MATTHSDHGMVCNPFRSWHGLQSIQTMAWSATRGPWSQALWLPRLEGFLTSARYKSPVRNCPPARPPARPSHPPPPPPSHTNNHFPSLRPRARGAARGGAVQERTAGEMVNPMSAATHSDHGPICNPFRPRHDLQPVRPFAPRAHGRGGAGADDGGDRQPHVHRRRAHVPGDGRAPPPAPAAPAALLDRFEPRTATRTANRNTFQATAAPRRRRPGPTRRFRFRFGP